MECICNHNSYDLLLYTFYNAAVEQQYISEHETSHIYTQYFNVYSLLAALLLSQQTKFELLPKFCRCGMNWTFSLFDPLLGEQQHKPMALIIFHEYEYCISLDPALLLGQLVHICLRHHTRLYINASKQDKFLISKGEKWVKNTVYINSICSITLHSENGLYP